MKTYAHTKSILAGLSLALLTACGGSRTGGGGSTPSEGGAPGGGSTFAPSEPQFKKEGRLEFLTPQGDTISKIDLEVAATDAEREQGLMYRTTIAESTGMIFLFDRPEIQSFWMKNTPSSLDIIFVSPDNRIVNIHAYTSPYSTESLPSTGLSDKVVEVKGGYCEKHKIGPGTRIAFQLAKS